MNTTGTMAKKISPLLTTDSVPAQARLPSTAAMRGLTNDGLLEVLQQYGIAPPPQVAAQGAQQYVTRMTNYPPGSAAWKSAVADMRNVESKRVLLGMAREVREGWSTLQTVNGNLKMTMIRVDEGDDSECDSCSALGGDVHTFEEWISIGLPGSASCDGGSLCRCSLVEYG